MEIEPLKIAHIRAIAATSAGAIVKPLLEVPGGIEALITAPNVAFAGLVDGTPIGAVGLTHQWMGRAVCWAIFTPACRYHMTAIRRASLRFLDQCGYRRVEGYSRMDFEASHRWHQMLGFKPEGVMRAFDPDGNDSMLYARLK